MPISSILLLFLLPKIHSTFREGVQKNPSDQDQFKISWPAFTQHSITLIAVKKLTSHSP